MEHSGIVKSGKEFGLGVAGLLLITLAAIRLGLQPGAQAAQSLQGQVHAPVPEPRAIQGQLIGLG